ncbi:MAG: efflux RND transporter periplasmic adaptor subunit [Dyella sp.]
MSHNEAAAPMPHHRPRLKPVIVGALVVAIVAVAAGIALRAHDYNQLVQWTADQEIPTVALIGPNAPSGLHDISLPGQLQAWIDTPIRAQVSGYLKSWKTDIGAKVNAGDLLGTIETPELDQQFAQAKAGLARTKADAQLAQITAKRWNNLLASNSVSKQEADEKTAQAQVAQANVQSAQADVDRLAAQESFKQVVAPFSGTITNRQTDVGNLVSANGGTGSTLFNLADTRRMRLYVEVPQGYAGSITPGLPVKLTVLEHPGKTYRAIEMGSAGAVDPHSGSQLVQFEVDNTDADLLPGDYAQVAVPLTNNPKLITVPATALIFRAQGAQVAVVGPDDRVQLRSIHIVQDLGNVLKIDQGIMPGDKIIDHPPDSLAQGNKVRIASTSDANPTAKKMG